MDELEKYHIKRMLRHIGWVTECLEQVANSEVGQEVGFTLGNAKILASKHDQDKLHGKLLDQYKYISWQYKCKLENKPCDIKYTPAMDDATTEHIKNNKHHPEYWDPNYVPNVTTDFANRDSTKANSVSGTSMDEFSIIELCCDWKATGKERGNSAKSWADICKRDKRYTFTPAQWDFIYKVLEVID